MVALLILVPIAVLILALILIRRRAGPSAGQLERQLAACLEAGGAARCLTARDLLDGLARRGDGQLIEAVWERLELPLLEAVPDCPPAARPALIDVLERCHRCTTRRTLQRRLIDMRNGLAAGTDRDLIDFGG